MRILALEAAQPATLLMGAVMHVFFPEQSGAAESRIR